MVIDIRGGMFYHRTHNLSYFENYVSLVSPSFCYTCQTIEPYNKVVVSMYKIIPKHKHFVLFIQCLPRRPPKNKFKTN